MDINFLINHFFRGYKNKCFVRDISCGTAIGNNATVLIIKNKKLVKEILSIKYISPLKQLSVASVEKIESMIDKKIGFIKDLQVDRDLEFYKTEYLKNLSSCCSILGQIYINVKFLKPLIYFGDTKLNWLNYKTVVRFEDKNYILFIMPVIVTPTEIWPYYKYKYKSLLCKGEIKHENAAGNIR